QRSTSPPSREHSLAETIFDKHDAATPRLLVHPIRFGTQGINLEKGRNRRHRASSPTSPSSGCPFSHGHTFSLCHPERRPHPGLAGMRRSPALRGPERASPATPQQGILSTDLYLSICVQPLIKCQECCAVTLIDARDKDALNSQRKIHSSP